MNRLIGSELSPYSVKVRSYLRYKGIPHEWVLRTAETEAEFQKHAKLPLIPLVVTAKGEGLQDSTPIIERFEAANPEPALQPSDPTLAFISALIEEYADEWLNKPMFHYRWTYEADQIATADRIAAQRMAGASDAERAEASKAIRQRMVARLPLVGSSAATAGIIEGSCRRALDILEVHLAHRPFLFGGRPALADFGVWGQLYEMNTDPTPAKLVAAHPRVAAWVARMLDPKPAGGFEAWPALAPSLGRLLREEVAGVFLPWSVANAKAVSDGAQRLNVSLEGKAFTQDPQKYAARSLAVIRGKYAAVKGDQALRTILAETGCLAFLE
jgi:glutathione S-transferase